LSCAGRTAKRSEAPLFNTALFVNLLLTQSAAYLVGAIPFGYLVAKWVKGVDIRTYKSGNIGATNVGRLLGFRFFVLVFVLDFLKGLLPTLAAVAVQARVVGDDALPPRSLWYLPEAAGFAAMIGHMFPVYLGFKGGKGVATSIGVFLALAPWPTFAGVAGFLTVFAVTRVVALGSLAFAAAFAAVYFSYTPDPWSLPTVGRSLLAVAAVLLIVVAHRGNIARLLSGKEHRIGETQRDAGSAPPS
jgi:glycerol-3-phosphate acyltransferase PlsY